MSRQRSSGRHGFVFIAGNAGDEAILDAMAPEPRSTAKAACGDRMPSLPASRNLAIHQAQAKRNLLQVQCKYLALNAARRRPILANRQHLGSNAGLPS
jgi:hypothetical protein